MNIQKAKTILRLYEMFPLDGNLLISINPCIIGLQNYKGGFNSRIGYEIYLFNKEEDYFEFTINVNEYTLVSALELIERAYK
jgi:hypothetical protein